MCVRGLGSICQAKGKSNPQDLLFTVSIGRASEGKVRREYNKEHDRRRDHGEEGVGFVGIMKCLI